MPSPPTARQQDIAVFLESEARERGIMPTHREIAERFGFASQNSVRSHLKLMEKKGMVARLPGKARGLRLRPNSQGIPLVGQIAAGHPRMATQEADEFLPVATHLFHGAELFALRVRGDSMKNAGILSGDIAVLNRQPEVADGEIAAVLLDDDATLKFVHRRPGVVVLRGANPAFPDIVLSGDAPRSLQILGKYVGLIRQQGGAS
ncbi:MAG: transcriptional repressor LexA [Limisphaerales bacterium]